MKIKVSSIVKADNDNDYLRKVIYRWRSKGLPAVEVIWDIPWTKELEQEVDEFQRDVFWKYDPVFLAYLRRSWKAEREERLARKRQQTLSNYTNKEALLTLPTSCEKEVRK